MRYFKDEKSSRLYGVNGQYRQRKLHLPSEYRRKDQTRSWLSTHLLAILRDFSREKVSNEGTAVETKVRRDKGSALGQRKVQGNRGKECKLQEECFGAIIRPYEREEQQFIKISVEERRRNNKSVHFSASYRVLLQQHHRRKLPREAGKRSDQVATEDEIYIIKWENVPCPKNQQTFIVIGRSLKRRRKLSWEIGKNARITLAWTSALTLKNWGIDLQRMHFPTLNQRNLQGIARIASLA